MSDASVDRSGLALYGARVAISAVGFLSTVFFARELGAAGLGVYFTFETLVNVLAVFARFGVDNAVVKRLSGSTDSEERAAYLTGALLLVTVPLLAVALGVVAFGSVLDSLVELAVVPLLVAVLAVETGQWVLISALRGERRIATSAGVELGGELVRVGVSVALVVSGLGAIGLVYGLLAGHAVRALASLALLETGFARPTRATVERLLAFSKYTAGMNVSHLAYSWFDTLVLAVLATKADVGVYEAAWRVSLVVMLASSSIGAALAPNVSAWREREEWVRIERGFSESLTFASLVVVPAVVGVALLGDSFMRTVYRFETGGAILLVLVAGQLLQSVKDVTQSTLLGTERQRAVFWTNVLSLGANVVLTVALVLQFGPLGAAVGTALTAGVAAAVQFRYVRGFLEASIEWRSLAWQVGGALVMGGVVWTASRVVSADTPAGLAALVLLGVATYGGVLAVHTDTRHRVLAMVGRPVNT